MLGCHVTIARRIPEVSSVSAPRPPALCLPTDPGPVDLNEGTDAGKVMAGKGRMRNPGKLLQCCIHFLLGYPPVYTVCLPKMNKVIQYYLRL